MSTSGFGVNAWTSSSSTLRTRLFKGQPHYGRFMEIDRPGRIKHSWMSRKTLGEESTVTVTFQKKGEDTLMTLQHSGLTSDDMAQAHEKGWNFILGRFVEIC